jgi:hypothetical protein
VDPIQVADLDGICGRFACRVASVERRVPSERDTSDARDRRARTLLRERGFDPDGVDWAVVPSNPAALRELDGEAADAFRNHLRRLLDAGGAPSPEDRARPPHAPPRDEPARDGPPPRESEALTGACTACRGWCCRRGGSHAFLDETSLSRIRRQHPDLDSTALLALYDRFLGPNHLEGGCVFQGGGGCRLPRALRSDTCNDWWCEDVERIRARWRDHDLEPGDTRFIPVLPGEPPDA